jgi:hypothetical protein
MGWGEGGSDEFSRESSAGKRSFTFISNIVAKLTHIHITKIVFFPFCVLLFDVFYVKCTYIAGHR